MLAKGGVWIMSTETLPKIRKASFKIDTSKSREWLKAHRHEYIGKWVVLDGDKLIGAGDDPRHIFEQARAQGVRVPFVKFIQESLEPFMGGWS
jgi:hypothetical protein